MQKCNFIMKSKCTESFSGGRCHGKLLCENEKMEGDMQSATKDLKVNTRGKPMNRQGQ